MTLHWWMHWFWVTAQFFVILGNPVPSSTVEPQSQVQVHQDLKPASEIPSVDGEAVYTVNPTRQSFRVAKAIGLYPPTNTAVILNRQVTTTVPGPMERVSTVEIVTPNSTSVAEDFHESTSSTEKVDVSKVSISSRPENMERARSSGVKKESKITWILTTNKTGRSKYDQEDKVQEAVNSERNISSTEEVEDLTVLPLQEEISRVRLILNRTKPSAPLLSSSSLSASVDTLGRTAIRTFNRSDDDVEINEELGEPQSLETVTSIPQVIASESTRLSRARSTFPKDSQRNQVQGKDLADYNESSSSVEESQIGSPSSHSAVDIAAITGSCLATVVVLSTMGSLGFIMYRRRYLNPPQTLNSDKCSNPDSSGYIDDSTIRDNSEEMYSLDNDSFLNSLEAMTIQNYWTDSVKHTKL